MYRLDQLSRRPQRPSEILRMREAGYPDGICIDLDLAVLEFGDWVEGRANETVEEHVPKPPKNPPHTKTVRKYKSLNALLGIDDDEDGTKVVASADVADQARELRTGQRNYRDIGQVD